MRAIEAKGQPNDDALRIVTDRDLSQPPREGVLRLGRHGRERLGDGLGGVAERDANTLRARIDRQYPHSNDYGFGVGDGPGDGVAVGVVVVGTAPDSTT